MSKFNLTAQIQLQAPKNAAQVVNQIQRQLQNINVNVNLKGAPQAQRQIQNLAKSTSQAANASTKLGKALTASIKRYAGLAIATRAVSLFTNTLSNAVQESIDFQRELIKVAQVTGKSLQELKGLTSEITRLSTSLGAASSSLIGVSRILSQAGLSANETRIALDALARSTLAPTFDNITQTAEGAVAIFNQFREGAQALEKQLGAINAVAGQFAVEAGDLIAVIRRTGGVFKSAGGDLNELIALFTSVRATTRESAESIATGLRTIFTRIQRPKTIEFLREFGVELVGLDGKFVGPYEAVKRLSAALAGLEQGDLTFIKIAEELGGFRQIGKVIPLIQEFRIAQEALNVAIAGGDSLTKDALTAQQALAVQIAKVREQFLALIRGVFESQSFQLFAKTSLNIASALLKVGEALKPLIPLLTTFAAINIARGAAGLIGGLSRPRGFNAGGMVPGSGNRDTVPAMLTPGEFVIRKSSVASIGAENLASMNKYAYGGTVKSLGTTYTSIPRTKGYDKLQNRRVQDNSKFVKVIPNEKDLDVWNNSRSFKHGDKFEEVLAKSRRFNTGRRATGPFDILDFPQTRSEAKFLPLNARYGKGENDRNAKGNTGKSIAAKNFLFENSRGTNRRPSSLSTTALAGKPVTTYYTDPSLWLKKMATGGGVSGTDTVPAMLTPGEFVMNKASAQNIGYSNLNRMNKVGKYANGGIVQGFNTGGTIRSPLLSGGTSKGTVPVSIQSVSSVAASMLGGGLGGGGGVIASAASGGGSGPRGLVAAKGTKRGNLPSKSRSVDSLSGIGFGLTAATAALATFAPTVDENSNAQERAIAALANSATTLAATFGGLASISESFGVSLGDAFRGGLGKKAKNAVQEDIIARSQAKASGIKQSARDRTKADIESGQIDLSTSKGRETARKRAEKARKSAAGVERRGRGFARAGGSAAQVGTQAAVGVAAFTAAFNAAQSLAQVFKELSGITKEMQDAIEDGNVALAERKAAEANAEERTLNTASGIVGGAAAGFAVAGPLGAALGAAAGGILADFLTPPKETAVALAGAQAAATKAAKSMADATKEVTKRMSEFRLGNISGDELFEPLIKAQEDAALARRKGAAAEGEAADFGQTLPGAMSQAFGFSKSSDAIRRENEAAQKQRREQMKETSTPAVRALAMQAAGGGQDEQQFREFLQSTGLSLKDLEMAGVNVKDIFASAEKEVERARKQFELLNLGLSNVNATADASIAVLNNLGNITDLGANSQVENSLNTLTAGLTAAAQGIDLADFQKAVDTGVGVLQGLGASDESINKFKNTTQAINSVQSEIPNALERVKKTFDASGGKVSVKDLRQKFADEISGSLKGVVDEDTLSNLTDLIAEGELSPEDVKAIQGGDMSPLQKLVDEFGEGAMKEFTEAFKKAAEIENKLVAITSQRINLENQLVASQQKVLSAQMEAAQIIAEFGGPAVTPDQQRANIIQSANTQSGVIGGISNLQSGSAAELTNRNREINAQLQNIDTQRSAVAAGGGGLGRVEGTELQAQQDRLIKLAQDQYNVTKQLIDVRKQELRTIQARNKAEKDGLESLLDGDFEGFFDAQAAAGATAAIATGNTQLASAYGPGGLAGAFKNLQQMQSQGVTTAFGQNIGGAGGLLEQSAGAALGTFGMQGSADVLAGTTPEEAALQSEIQGLAKTLPDTAQVQANAAEMMLKAAVIQQQVAQAELAEVRERVQNRAGGGLIYASRGMFVPRGTDTVPAMLTPGEFVVRRAAVQRGNNLQMLKAMNSGAVSDSATQALSSGGQVRYLQNGCEATGGGLGISSETLNSFASALNNFNTQLATNIQNLQNTQFQITLNPANINVNLTGTSFLEKLTSTLKQELFSFVGQEIAQHSVGPDGRLTKDNRRV